MPLLPATKNVVWVQGGTFLYVVRDTKNAQTITLAGGPTGGTWKIVTLYGTTGNLAYNASAVDVALALQALPRIGGNGVAVSRSGSGSAGSPYVYVLTWAGALAGVDVEQVGVISSLTGGTPAIPAVDFVPVDYSAGTWTARMVVAPKNQNGTFGTTILTLTDASDPATVGKIYIGWVDMGEGVLPTGGDLVPSNGVIAIYVPAVKTAALTAADFVNAEGKPAGWYDLLLVKSAYKKALLKGSVTLDMEPS